MFDFSGKGTLAEGLSRSRGVLGQCLVVRAELFGENSVELEAPAQVILFSV